MTTYQLSNSYRLEPKVGQIGPTFYIDWENREIIESPPDLKVTQVIGAVVDESLGLVAKTEIKS